MEIGTTIGRMALFVSTAARKILSLRINGQILIDGGDIDADDELQNAFPDLDGSNIIFRKLNISTYGNIYNTFDFKIGIDFANVRDIQDIWIRYLKNPLSKKNQNRQYERAVLAGKSHQHHPDHLYGKGIARRSFWQRSQYRYKIRQLKIRQTDKLRSRGFFEYRFFFDGG